MTKRLSMPRARSDFELLGMTGERWNRLRLSFLGFGSR